jgi:tetratricopeptide (TPR) repeat protein
LPSDSVLARVLPLLPWLAVGGIAAFAVLWWIWPWLSGRFPRATALLVPHLLLAGLLLLPIAGLFTGIVHGTSRLWSEHTALWHQLTRSRPALETLDWLWPWFPTLLGLFLLLLLAAVTLSRRPFHGLALLAVVSVVLGVALHEEPSAGDPAPALLEGAPRSLPEVASQRLADRILEPVTHHQHLRLDSISAAVLGVLALLGFNWLDRLNLRRALQPIRVARIIEEGRDSEGKPRTRPDLEDLMRECLHRQTPHNPSPLPGGALEYWQDFVEQQSARDNHWFTRALAFVMRLVRPPSGLEITGTLLHTDGPGAPTWGIRLSMVDLRTGQTLMARTISSDVSPERAVEQAAYCAVERAIAECRLLPEWNYWEEGDGSALWKYHQGVQKLHAYSANASAPPEDARKLLEEAARESLGSAMVRLQLAEALEACGDYVSAVEIYLQVCERYPRLLVAKVRLASTCRSATSWARQLDGPDGTRPAAPEPVALFPHQRLRVALEGRLARRLRRPTLPSRLIERQLLLQQHAAQARQGPGPRRDAPWGRPPRVRRGRPILFGERDTVRLEWVLLNMSARALKQLVMFGRWEVFTQCLRSTTDRRLFWQTLLTPPQKRRDLNLAMRAARGCIEWHQLSKLEELYSRSREYLQEGRPPAHSPVRHRLRWHLTWLHWKLSHPPLGLQKRWCQYQMYRVAHHASRAAGIRPNWLGTANYHLAGFYSVCMGDQVLALPRKPVPESHSWRAPELGERLEEQQPFGKALEALEHGSALFQGAWECAREAFAGYREHPRSNLVGNLEAANTLMEKLLECGKLLPAESRPARGRIVRQRHLLERQYRRTWRTASTRGALLREQRENLSRFWPPAPDSPDRFRAQALQVRLEQALDLLLQQYELLVEPGRDSRPPAPEVEALHARAEDVRELLAQARTFLLTPGTTRHLVTRTALLGLLEVTRCRLDALMRLPLARLRALKMLALRLEAQEDAIANLQELCRHARTVQALGQRACEHLSQSIRDPDGPFTTSTKKWLLGAPDFQPLQVQHSFRAWEWVTLRQMSRPGTAPP